MSNSIGPFGPHWSTLQTIPSAELSFNYVNRLYQATAQIVIPKFVLHHAAYIR